MSYQSNKLLAKDFGLVETEPGIAVDPKDGSMWQRAVLYDYGWGPETGFYKLPLPDFSSLFAIVLNSDDKEDQYGAASIIENRYLNELLSKCEEMMKDPRNEKSFAVLDKVFYLSEPPYCSRILYRSKADVDRDRWMALYRYVKSLSEGKHIFKQKASATPEQCGEEKDCITSFNRITKRANSPKEESNLQWLRIVFSTLVIIVLIILAIVFGVDGNNGGVVWIITILLIITMGGVIAISIVKLIKLKKAKDLPPPSEAISSMQKRDG